MICPVLEGYDMVDQMHVVMLEKNILFEIILDGLS